MENNTQQTPAAGIPSTASGQEKPQMVNPPSNNQTPVEQIPAWAKTLITQNKELAAKNEELSKDVQMFKDMAGKNNMQSYLDGQEDFTVKKAHFKVINGKAVVAWSNLDMTHYNPRAYDALGENIFTTVTFEDGTQEKINLQELNTCADLVYFEIVSQERKGENDTCTLKNSDGETIKVLNKFLNR